MRDVLERPLEQLRRRVPDDLAHRRVDTEEPSVGRDNSDADWRVLERETELFLGLTQARLVTTEFGDVLARAAHDDRLAVVVEVHLRTAVENPLFTVGPH